MARVALTLALLFAACSRESPPDRSPSSIAEPRATSAATRPAVPSATRELPAPPAAAAVPVRAPREPGPHCEAAHTAMLAMIEAIVSADPASQARPPDRDRFMLACAQLPTTMQRCMLTEYAAAHRDECAAARASLDDETRERLQSLMSGR